ncbi:hypothetical protein NGTWS1803_34120 [Mycolicibacterium cyprinidarum]|nr:hypothetical protein NGTWS1803_34120 [Mycolicibacterium sp. NGTWS1803]
MSDPAPMRRGDVVVVTGPGSAGVTSMVRELRARMPMRRFVETHEITPGDTAAAVVLVVSAVAPVAESDCTLAGLAAAQADVVVAVVSKIDDHRSWRGVLAANRERLAECDARFQHVPWVGAAAAPRSGRPLMDGVVELLEQQLSDPESIRQTSLRASEFRLRAEVSRLNAAAAGADRRARVDALRESRDELLRQRVLLVPAATIALRSRIQQARVALTYSARNHCASARAELLERIAGTPRRLFGGFELDEVQEGVRQRCRDIVADVDEEITVRTREVASELGLTDPPRPAPAAVAAFTDPPVASRRLETQLMAVLGAGFGLGIALLVSRFSAGLAPRNPGAGLTAAAVVGLAVTVWMVRSRGLLHDRAMLDRWVNEVIREVRAVVEEQVIIRVLTAEAVLSPKYVASVDAQKRAVDLRIAAIEAELREQAREIAQAEDVRERELPPLREALQAVRTVLAEVNPTESDVTGR